MPACRSMACYSFASAARSEWLADAGIRTACHVIDVIDGLLPTIDFGATSGASSTHQYVGPCPPRCAISAKADPMVALRNDSSITSGARLVSEREALVMLRSQMEMGDRAVQP